MLVIIPFVLSDDKWGGVLSRMQGELPCLSREFWSSSGYPGQPLGLPWQQRQGKAVGRQRRPSSSLELIPVLVREGLKVCREGREKPIAVLIEGTVPLPLVSGNPILLAGSAKSPAWAEGLLVCGEAVSLRAWGKICFLSPSEEWP